ncbi:glycosyltransferase [Chitinophaga ginsengisegetis]|uniref:glycosyltransferase n=1 Tax=Chitinophaga ginsengisegetis TaxID=393003 RepID=UPI000DBA0273|nr:glycosyltransferase [Chitinophaga ginsengisegetis]MDR6566558.1 glycosyltransferase involved in cell wall biosynthesis [Chitinophaga ginsengisegetis]MDR6646288.1 glycosyltransferase involved in cell wall biosynthesis [Chitinophaga ginsengisegetis]MDR6651119.1 glycosyltransferase involved in cell wall biosynthesis [Chitinophaga ginsengisegetis]
MQKKKIVHIIPSLSKGGAERFVTDLSNELSTIEQYEIHLISLSHNSPEDTFLSELTPGVIYHCMNKKPGFDAATLIRLTQLLRQISPHVIHTHINALEYTIPYSLLSGKKSLSYHTVHNDAFKECEIPLLRKLRGIFYRYSLIKPVTISRSSSESFRKCYHLSNDVLIENGRFSLKQVETDDDLKLFPEEIGDAFVIVNIARIARAKNQSLLIDAVELYNAENKRKCVLAIVGSVVDPVFYEELLAKKSKYIFFTGPRSQIATILHKADVFALSSLYEGMPISLIEAFSVGCIPVCTPVGGITDMISHGETGFLSDDMTVESYKKALTQGLQTVDRPKIQQKCKEEFNSKYHIAVSARKYTDLYEQR